MEEQRMKLTPDLLADYIGGQMEIQNHVEDILYRGQITELVIRKNKLCATFAWMAKAENFPLVAVPIRWLAHDMRTYYVDLSIYRARDMDRGSKGGMRILLSSPTTTELIILFPADGNKLDPQRVVGISLEHEAAQE